MNRTPDQDKIKDAFSTPAPDGKFVQNVYINDRLVFYEPESYPKNIYKYGFDDFHRYDKEGNILV